MTAALEAAASRAFLAPAVGVTQTREATMNTKTLTQADLAQFIGSEHWYRHTLNRAMLYTEGAQYLAEHGGAYWLLDAIAISNRHEKAVAAEEFQVWTLTVNSNRTATLCCGDGNGKAVYRQEIEFTDFPLPEVKLYCCGNTILLPSEY